MGVLHAQDNIGLIIKCDVKYNIGVTQQCRAIGNITQ